MNVHVVGLQKEALKKEIQENYPKLHLVDKNPEMVICYGGDGTLLYGEREFPGVPKALIRNSQVCHHCSEEAKESILNALIQKQYSIQEHPKLIAEHNGKQLTGINDIMIGHTRVNASVRFTFFIHGKQYGREMIGDGIVVSTPLGSTGYYQSITKSHFQDGFGIAFNNTVNTVSHVVMSDLKECHIRITRGPAVVAADNNEEVISLSTGDEVAIRVASEKALIVEFADERCKLNIMTGLQRPSLGYCHICRKQYQ